jgi:hypothetical protein
MDQVVRKRRNYGRKMVEAAGIEAACPPTPAYRDRAYSAEPEVHRRVATAANDARSTVSAHPATDLIQPDPRHSDGPARPA